MPESFSEFLRLVAMIPVSRPYVAAFLVTFLFAVTAHFGARRTLLYCGVALGIAWAAEFSSIRTGIPFGKYYYFEDLLGDRDLFIGRVAIFSSLSFVFLIYVSYSMAVFLTRTFVVRGLSVEFVGGEASPRTWPVRVLAAFLHVAMDIVVDPISYHGDKWFLGEMWRYETPAFFYGIPITNFLAWVVLAIVVLSVYHWLEEWGERRGWLPERRSGPLSPRVLLGPCCYFGVYGFILTISVWLAATHTGALMREFTILTAVGIGLAALSGVPFLRRLLEARRLGATSAGASGPSSAPVGPIP